MSHSWIGIAILLRQQRNVPMKRLIFWLVAIAFVASISDRANAAILYSQPSNNFGFFYSQHDTSGSGSDATTYDNFTLGSTSTISSVSWDGGFLPGTHTAITSFTLTFYSDNAGQPGAAIDVETISGNAGETATGTDTLLDDTFAYSATLPTAFTATGGTQYWLSIVGNMNSGGAFIFGWMNSNAGDGVGYQDLFSQRAEKTDSAFTLSGTASSVPEPSSFATLSIGMGICGVIAYRKRMNAARVA